VVKSRSAWLSKGPNERGGLIGKALANPIVGDDGDPSVGHLKVEDVAAPDVFKTAGARDAAMTAGIPAETGTDRCVSTYGPPCSCHRSWPTPRRGERCVRVDERGWLVAETGDPRVVRDPTVRTRALVEPGPLGVV
jgi:hypothetical protein